MERLSENALKVLEARYLRKDEEGKIIESPEELFQRVAQAVAQAEATWNDPDASIWEDRFYQAMTSLEFLPNSPTLMNAGTELGQLSACFVLPVADTMEGIFEAVKKMALVQRTGGGTGFSFSRLRPKGSYLESTSGEASGPVSFMKIFDAATEHIKQGGRRRGANMGILRVDHPDILEFITSKLDGKSLQNFNISVAVTDHFLEAAREERLYDLIDPRTGKKSGQLDAASVFKTITETAWETGDPGLIFIDAINRNHPTPKLGMIEATNPCGEIPLLDYEACNLGSINLSRMVTIKGRETEIDWRKLRETTRLGVRFLDDVIEVNHYPFTEIDRIARGNRKIGLGIMGFAEMLILLRISYDSDRAVQLGEEIMKVIFEEAEKASLDLAEQRGVFPNWKGSVYEKENKRLRNATLTAVAPTGTISILAGTSASIEPLFALAYRRHALEGKVLVEINSLFAEYLRDHDLNIERIQEQVMKTGRVPNLPTLPHEMRELFKTALEIPVSRHLEMQAAFQKYVDNSVSKTINLPQEATREDVSGAYWHAWEMGLKGITIFRHGSKSSQVIELGAFETPMNYEYTPRCDPGECKL